MKPDKLFEEPQWHIKFSISRGLCHFAKVDLCSIMLNDSHDIYYQVKNKMPAAVQITAEQLLREAKERELELSQPVS